MTKPPERSARADQLELHLRRRRWAAAEGAVIPVDYKRGKRPHVPLGAYEPERIEVCLQAFLLEEHGRPALAFSI